MIRPSPFGPEYHVVPQAIFWRPISYFSTSIRVDKDELDTFTATYFTIDNLINFDLRKYKNHPDHTVSVYLPFEIKAERQISEHIDLVASAFVLPEYAIAWRRGWNFTYGVLKRRDEDRLREAEARILALKIAATCPGYTAATEYIKRQVPKFYEPSTIDVKPSFTRSRESLWQQIVGNVISHQETSTGLFKKGYATRTADGLAVTNQGISYLNSIGFGV